MGRGLFVAAVLIAAIAFDLHYALPNAASDSAIDYRVFWRAASRPLADVYQTGHMPFVYPPTALVLFKPLALLPQHSGFFIWAGISALLFGLCVARLASGRVAALTFLSPAAVKGIILGQSAMLLGGALFWALLMPPMLGGALLGAVLVVKPQILLFAPLAFLVRRDWKVLTGMAAGSAAMLAASLVAFGPQLWADWLQALPAFRDTLVQDGVLDRVVTPAGRAEHVGLPSWPFILTGLALGAAAVVSAARKLEGAQLIALIVSASLVASPYAHVHDTIALVPACLILVMRGPWWAAVLAALVFIGAPGLTMLAMMLGLVALALMSSSLLRLSTARQGHAD